MSGTDDDPKVRDAAPESLERPGPPKSLTVLVVEDNRVNQKVVVGLLTTWGHQAEVAGDGARGLEAFESRSFDLILMDVQMPVMDGLHATRSIRARERQRGGHVPIIAITAHSRTVDRLSCFDAGVDAYMTKPIQPKLLRQTIAELIPDAAYEPPATAPSRGPVDFDQLKEYVGEDPVLLAEVIQVFLDDSPVALENATRAISAKDANALEISAHRLKGSLATMGAEAAAELASRLEKMGHEGALEGAAELCERLTREVEAAQESLRSWSAQSAA